MVLAQTQMEQQKTKGHVTVNQIKIGVLPANTATRANAHHSPTAVALFAHRDPLAAQTTSVRMATPVQILTALRC